MNIANLKELPVRNPMSLTILQILDPFRHPAKQVFKYLCDDCYKTLSARLSPSYTRLRKAQALLNGKGEEEEEMDDEE